MARPLHLLRAALGATTLATTLAASGIGGGIAIADTQPAEKPVEVGNYDVDEARAAASDVSDPAWANPTVTLPPAGATVVDIPASGWADAGTLPLALAAPSAGVAASRVRVRMLSQAEVAAAGGRLLGFELTRADGSGSVGAVAVRIDYAGIAKAYGGDFGSRLQLVRAVSCNPDAPCVRPAVAAANALADAELTAMSVAVRPDPAAAPTAPAPGSGLGPQPGDPDSALLDPYTGGTTYTAAASAAGPNGDYSASQLAASENWSVGVGSGAFTYRYGIKVPPAVAGPAPALALTYNSQSVDGRSLAANGQVSKVGEGWNFEPGFIERRFHSCRDENVARDDLCWSNDAEYFINFMGHSGEIVRTSTSSKEWRLRGDDPGWRILSYTACCSNGDNDGEYFVVITPSGTKYWFGYGIEPRNTPTKYTNSAWTVPVYGNNAGEPCYSTITASSWCQQAYRWNVDRVLDTNNNVSSLFYAKEINRYSRNATTTLPTEYTRSGYLTSIEYGQRDGTEDAVAYARVRVNTMDRCVSQVACPTPTTSSAQTSYPDVPLDRMCTSATSCSSDQTSPTFWSTKQITSIQTEFYNAETAGYELVGTDRMTYSFPTTGDSTSPSLWLVDITHTGEYGVGSTELPGVRMGGVALPNRVNTGAGLSPLNKYRVASIATELGAQVRVTYDTPRACPLAPSYPAWDTNPYHCYPTWYDPQDGQTQPGWVAFHKYLVTDLVTADVRGGGEDKTVSYTYGDAPAWHHEDSRLTKPERQTWSDYRGHADVRVNVAGGGASEGTDTRYLVFRGMYGDKLADGTAKSVQLTDSTGAWFNDFHYRAGQTLEAKRYDPSDGHFASTLYRYWAQQTVNAPDGFSPHDAYYVRPSQTINRTKNLDTAAWRSHDVSYTYDASSAMLTETSDEAMPGTAGDDLCTKVGFTDLATAPNVGTSGGNTHWMVDRPYRTITYAGLCGSGSTTVVSQTEYDYDGHAYQAAPTNGNVTQTRASIDATTTAITKTSYDSHGRVTSVISPNEVAAGTNGATTTTYSPATGYPYNGVTTTNVLGQSETTVFYAAFGTPRRITDANADTTTISIDHLGRTTAVTRPHPTDSTGVTSHTFAYRIESGVPNRVTTTRVLTTSSSVTSVDYLDGLGRVIQTQLPPADGSSSGRRLIVHRYDTLGQKAAESTPFAATGDVGSGLATYNLADVPLEVRYGYDSAGRVYAETQYAAGVSKFSTRTEHHGWHHVVDAPVAADVDYHTDVVGRVTQITQRPVAGTTNTYYGYTPLGDLDTITDPEGNVTNYDYDRLRRRTLTSDPDQGTWRLGYNREGDVTSVLDAKNQTVSYVFDRLRRKTDAYAGDAATGTLLARWRYDTAPGGAAVTNGLGRLTAATRFTGGAEYTTTIGGYDNRGRISAKTTTIPSSVGALAGSYTFGYGYNLADEQTSVALPAAGGLPAETVTTNLNGAGLPVSLATSLDASAPYIASTAYDLAGRVSQHSLVGGVLRTYGYDTAAGRLATVTASAPLTANGGVPGVIEDVAYRYDADGNVTSITDVIAGTGGVAQRECFRYDPLNRLTAAFTTNVTCSTSATPVNFGADPYDVAYSYNRLGDISSARTGATTSGYTYFGGSVRPHAPVSIGGAAYNYDANGATTLRPTPSGTQTLTWNALHQLESVSGPNAASFVYDASGVRLLRTEGSTKTLYLDGMELSATTAGGTTSVAATRYYGGVAMRTATGVRVLLRNHQNSTTAAYDTVSDTVAYQRYTPFGARRGTTPLAATDRRFLSKSEDGTGLVAMGARYYDPAIGRFAAADALVAPWQPANLSAYAYANNNPVTYADPSGMGPGCTDDFLDCDARQEEYAQRQAKKATAEYSGGGGSSGGGSSGSSGSSPATGSSTGTNTWADPDFVGPVAGPVIRDPADWCLVGLPAGTNGPCGPPPEYAEYDNKNKALAAIAYLSKYGGPVGDGASGAAIGATVSVAGYTTKNGKHVVGYTRYRQGLGDLSGVIKAKKIVVATKWAGRAFVALQFADAAADSWTNADVARHSTQYRVGHAVSSGVGAAYGGWAGAWAGMSVGAAGGAAVTSPTGPGAAIGGAVGGILGGIGGAMGMKWLTQNSYEFGYEVAG